MLITSIKTMNKLRFAMNFESPPFINNIANIKCFYIEIFTTETVCGILCFYAYSFICFLLKFNHE